MQKTAKLSEKRQIAIPKSICMHLGIEPGQEVLISESNGQIVITPKPKGYARKLRGLGKEVWKDIDPVDYIVRERGSWD